MSDTQGANPPAATRVKAPAKKQNGDRVIIRSFSDVIYLYPSWIMSLICGIWVSVSDATPGSPGNSGILFTVVFFFNLSVIAFDYTRLTSVVILLMVVIFGLISVMYPGFGEFLQGVLDQPMFMNATFYWVWAVLLTFTLLSVIIKTRFDYWEVKNNELLHHHGLLGDVERWPSPNMRISKEIRDVVEYALLRSGRLVLMPQRESRAIVIDNVPNINKIEDGMQKLLSTLSVDHVS